MALMIGMVFGLAASSAIAQPRPPVDAPRPATISGKDVPTGPNPPAPPEKTPGPAASGPAADSYTPPGEALRKARAAADAAAREVEKRVRTIDRGVGVCIPDDPWEALKKARRELEDAIYLESYQTPEYQKARAATEAANAELGPSATQDQVKARDAAIEAANAKQRAVGEAVRKAIRDYLGHEFHLKTERESAGEYRYTPLKCPEPSTTPAPPAAPGKDIHSSLAPGSGAGSDVSNAFLAQVNFARADPPGFARTFKGARSADAAETIAYLQGHAPVPALTAEPALASAAARQAADQASATALSHTGADGSGPMQRIQQVGLYSSLVGEEMALGQATAAGAVWQLLIDQGSAGKKHRADVMSAAFQFMGAACGPQATYKQICVIDLTGPIMARRPPAGGVAVTEGEARKPTRWCWFDSKTGKVVPDAPLSGRNLGGGPGAGAAQMDEPASDHAFNPKTGQNFVRQDGAWIDAKSGKTVPSSPLSGSNLGGGPGAGAAQMDEPVSDHAFNPKTGQNFHRAPCP